MTDINCNMAEESPTIRQVEEDKLTQMGYHGPEWDSFKLLRPFPTLTPSEDVLLCTELNPDQQFFVKVWPRIEGFFLEEEDLTVIFHAEIVLRHGMLVRIFRFCFYPNVTEDILWEFVLEKSLLVGLDRFLGQNNGLRQKWAWITDPCSLKQVDQHRFYTRSFDSQAHSTRYKINRGNTRYLDNLRTDFFQTVRELLREGLTTSSVADFVKLKDDDPIYYKGKELEFEQDGNQIVWSVSIRPISPFMKKPRTWFVNPKLTETEDKASLNSPSENSTSPTTNPFETSSGDITDQPSVLEQYEFQKQVVDQRISLFVEDIWPPIRRFYLQLTDLDDKLVKIPSVVVKMNGSPTKILELHFDCLNERNRWKVLMEVSALPRNNIKPADPPLGPWEECSDSDTSGPSEHRYTELRSYKLFEKRGASSLGSEDVNQHFIGLYQRWFFQELQWTLAHCFAHAELNALAVKQTTFDPQLFELGKDLQFSDEKYHWTWSFAVQKIPHYRTEETLETTWAYKLKPKFPRSLTLKSMRRISNSFIDSDAETSISSASQARLALRSELSVPDTRTKVTKSRTSIKQLVARTFRPVLRKFGGKNTASSKTDLNEDSASSRSTLNASSYLADGESVWSAADSKL